MNWYFLSRIAQRKSYFFLFPFLLLVSCLNNEGNTGVVVKIDIDKASVANKINHVLEKSQIIPLETTSESLIGEVSRIEYYQGKFFILDAFNAKALFVFSEQGKFLGKTKFGKGPGEMINPYAFCLDKGKNNLLIWDQTLNTLFTFDLGLKPISNQNLDVFISDINKVDGNYILHSQNYDAYTFNLFSEDFQELLASVDFPYKSWDGETYLRKTISLSKRKLLITPNDYHIYQLEGSNIKPLYYLDFGSKAFSQKVFHERGAGEIWSSVHKLKNVSFPMGVFETSDFLGFQAYYGKNLYTYLISNSDKSVFCVDDMIISGALPKCVVWGSTGADDNSLYALIDPDELTKYLEENGGDSLKIQKPDLDDNPSVIFLTIK